MALSVRGILLLWVAMLSLPVLAADTEQSLYMPRASQSLLLDAAGVGDRLVVAGDHGHILYSDDDGESWQQADVPTRAMLTAVYFASAERGWAVGHDGVILASVDGGQRWIVQRDGLAAQKQLNRQRVKELERQLAGCREAHAAAQQAQSVEPVPSCDDLVTLELEIADARDILEEPLHAPPLLDVVFLDEMRGVAVGAFNTILRTTDGGAHWESIATALDNPDEFHLNAITGSADGRLWIAAEGGLLFRSDDAGASWRALESPYYGSLFGIVRAPSQDTLLTFGLRGNLFRSQDGGESWQQVNTGSDRTLSGGLFVGNSYAVLVGAVGTLLVSADGGRTFVAHDWGGRHGLSAVASSGDATVLVGQGGAHRVSPFGGVR